MAEPVHELFGPLVRGRCAEAGFTLVELVTVILLLAILAAVSGPRFFSSQGFAADFFFDETLAALRYAQKLAIATGCNVQVTIASGSFALVLQDGPTTVDGCGGAGYSQAVVHPGTGQAGYSGSAPNGVSLSSTVSPLLFDPLGRALNASESVSNASITVGARSISVVGETGLAYEP